jgi:hypothetical protein
MATIDPIGNNPQKSSNNDDIHSRCITEKMPYILKTRSIVETQKTKPCRKPTKEAQSTGNSTASSLKPHSEETKIRYEQALRIKEQVRKRRCYLFLHDKAGAPHPLLGKYLLSSRKL